MELAHQELRQMSEPAYGTQLEHVDRSQLGERERQESQNAFFWQEGAAESALANPSSYTLHLLLPNTLNGMMPPFGAQSSLDA